MSESEVRERPREHPRCSCPRETTRVEAGETLQSGHTTRKKRNPVQGTARKKGLKTVRWEMVILQRQGRKEQGGKWHAMTLLQNSV